MPAALASCGEANATGFAVEADAAAVRLVDAADQLDQRRFARAVFADQRVDFARLHVEIDPMQRLHARRMISIRRELPKAPFL